MNQIFLETRMFRLLDGEEIMTLAFFVLIQYRSVTDRHLCSGYTSACKARYANALVKIAVFKYHSQGVWGMEVFPSGFQGQSPGGGLGAKPPEDEI